MTKKRIKNGRRILVERREMKEIETDGNDRHKKETKGYFRTFDIFSSVRHAVN